MTAALRASLQQRADLTYQHNTHLGRHGWLRLTPAYSVKVVQSLMARCDAGMRVLDPFCGAATTALCAAYAGHDAATTDINPFLIWLAEAKTARYDADTLSETRARGREAVALAGDPGFAGVAAPPIHNIERWWPDEAIRFLSRLRAALLQVSADSRPVRDLLSVAFCRTVIASSNAAFNHQSMSFKPGGQLTLAIDQDRGAAFLRDLEFVLAGAADNPDVQARVAFADARHMPDDLGGRFDRVITSPPYANRMSYIRELRPYMYWLDFLSSGREAGELDWQAIGGTWGVATSRLKDWVAPTGCPEFRLLDASVAAIRASGATHASLLANYVAKYFADMWRHLSAVTRHAAAGAEVHYIVGNSTFYGTLVPVEQIYAAMLAELGFSNVNCEPIRKRNSKKELIEFDVSASWR